jgi:hypothetical protein
MIIKLQFIQEYRCKCKRLLLALPGDDKTDQLFSRCLMAGQQDLLHSGRRLVHKKSAQRILLSRIPLNRIPSRRPLSLTVI